MKDELLKKRVLEKFEIEREYWQRKHIHWAIVTEEEISKTKARNIGYIHDYFDIRDYDVFQEMGSLYIEDLSLSLLQRLLNSKQNIRTTTNEFDTDTHLPFGSGVTLFNHLIAQKTIFLRFHLS